MDVSSQRSGGSHGQEITHALAAVLGSTEGNMAWNRATSVPGDALACLR